jgi:hypothetical protein
MLVAFVCACVKLIVIITLNIYIVTVYFCINCPDKTNHATIYCNKNKMQCAHCHATPGHMLLDCPLLRALAVSDTDKYLSEIGELFLLFLSYTFVHFIFCTFYILQLDIRSIKRRHNIVQQ